MSLETRKDLVGSAHTKDSKLDEYNKTDHITAKSLALFLGAVVALLKSGDVVASIANQLGDIF